jgi:dUTP pyrophosphatase
MIRGFEFVKGSSRINSIDVEISLPTRSTAGSAGYDFFSPKRALIEPKQSFLIWTDIKAYMLSDEVLKIYSRSSLAIKKGLIVKNLVGIIDSDYYSNPSNDGNIGICLYNMSETSEIVNVGDRIAQGIFEKYLAADNDTQSNIRNSGFGSTGH